MEDWPIVDRGCCELLAAKGGDWLGVTFKYIYLRTIAIRFFQVPAMWTFAINALFSASLTDTIDTLVPLPHTMFAWPDCR